MCVWFQEAVHVYNPERSLAENIFSIRIVREWTYPEASNHVRSSCDDICLDGYWCAAKGILMNVGRPEAWALLLILLAAPICFGASIAVNRRVAASAFALWSMAIIWGMFVSYSKLSRYLPEPELRTILLHSPFQYLFDIVALFLLLALPFLLIERAITVLRRDTQPRSHAQ